MEVKSKRHLRIRAPFDCEKGLPYTEVVVEGKRLENCEQVVNPRKSGVRISSLYLHRIGLIRRFPFLLELISQRLNTPNKIVDQDELNVEKVKVDTLIVGSGVSGLIALERSNGFLITNDTITDFLIDPLNQETTLYNRVKRILKTFQDKIVPGDFMGKFSEGYLLRLKNKMIIVNPSRIIFAVGGRYLPPIFEGNDLPNVISRRLFLKRRSLYKKILVLGSSDDAIKTALISGSKVLTPKGVRLFSKKYLELADQRGVEVEEVERLKVKPRSAKLDVEWDKGSSEVEALVFAPVKQPKLEAIANAGCDYRFYPNMTIYMPDHDMDGFMKSCGHFVAGGARGIWDEEASAISAEAIFDPESSSELNARIRETSLHDYYARSFVAIKSPYLFSEGGYVCFCEDVLWNDMNQVIRMGYSNVEAVKRVGGIGLGECQGKVCTYVAGSILSSQTLITFRSPIYPM
ncbi:ferredoxin [Metallosphaera sp.]|uniref:ferredoxin n=1 Tax=Metallosphaera sp. TaxID=2020860 RepID=UPI003168AF09